MRKGIIALISIIVCVLFFFIFRIGLKTSSVSPGDLNVLIITIDTLRADHLHCYGYKRIRTPNIDRLVREGVRFENAVCQAPLTAPSHASIMTSLYPHTHGVRINGYPLKVGALTLAEILKINKYKTAGFVSVNFMRKEISRLDQGFDVFNGPKGIEQPAEVVTRKAISWLNENKDAKFFLWVHYYDPHSGYNPPYPYNTMYDPSYTGPVTGSTEFLERLNQGGIKLSEADRKHIIALYDGEVTYTDKFVGVLMDHLKEMGVYKNTLVVLVADHGEALGEHDHYFGHSLQLYDPSIMVPLVFVNRSLLPSGRVIKKQVQTIDIMPTILDLLGLAATEEMEGKSLLFLIKGEKSLYLEKAFSETQNMRWGGLILTENLPSAEEIAQKVKGGKEISRCLRTPGWKFILSSEASKRENELYNLEENPGEEVNLIYEDRYAGDRLKAAIYCWMGKKESVKERTIMDEETIKSLKSLGYIN